MQSFVSFDISQTALEAIFSIWGYEVSLLELVAVITGALGVWLGTTGKKITWPWWAVSSLLYAWLFFEWQLYASAALQFVFIAAAIWGWLGWAPTGAKPRSASNKQRVLVLMIGIIVWLALAPLLKSIGAAAALPDSFGLIFSLIAQIIMVKEFTETWVVWLIVDLMYTVLYANQGLWFTSVLYGVFTLIAVRGWLNWARNNKKIINNE